MMVSAVTAATTPPTKAGEPARRFVREQRDRQQARAIPEELAEAGVAKHHVPCARNPPVAGLKPERDLSAFEPIALEEDAIGEPLERPEIIAGVVERVAANVIERGHADEHQPGNADQHKRAAQGRARLRHRHQCSDTERRNRPSHHIRADKTVARTRGEIGQPPAGGNS